MTATSVFDRSGRKLRDVVADPDDAEKSVTDARGNQTQQVQTGTGVTTTTNYGYDLANRLISSGVTNNAVNPLSTGATYAYNAQGQRVTRVEDEVVTHFYYTGSALLFTTVNEYVLQTQNILDPSGTIVASRRFEGQAATGQDPYAENYFFYRYDIRGSVTTIVDGEGAVVKSYDYDEFGVTTSTGDAFFNEVTFTGSIADASGLLYMNARYYNPSTARFLSQDTYTGSAFDPWTQHLYAYCNNNPVNMIDPTGHVARKLLFWSIDDEASNEKAGYYGSQEIYDEFAALYRNSYGTDFVPNPAWDTYTITKSTYIETKEDRIREKYFDSVSVISYLLLLTPFVAERAIVDAVAVATALFDVGTTSYGILMESDEEITRTLYTITATQNETRIARYADGTYTVSESYTYESQYRLGYGKEKFDKRIVDRMIDKRRTEKFVLY